MQFLRSLYLSKRFFILMGSIILLAILGYLLPWMLFLAHITLLVTIVAALVDLMLLYGTRCGIKANRDCPVKLSNGDINPIQINIENRYNIPIRVTIVDELPVQFQKRDLQHQLNMSGGKSSPISYDLRPVERGEYHFGKINIFVNTLVGIITRRYRFDQEKMIPTYPSFMQMHKYELLAISNRLHEAGVKKIRRIGHQMEFDQIRDYVRGDDYRTINWKATARKSQLMVNQFQDEKSQPVYCILDMGRSMKMPFEGMTLLDYAINSSLVISNTATIKHDKAGLITFGHKIQSMVPAQSNRPHMLKIMEVLYNQSPQFLEPNFEMLYATVLHKIKQRSLLLLFTNFQSLNSMKRQLPYLKGLARKHLLVVIFFSNSEIKKLMKKPSSSMEDIYVKTIGEKFHYDKKQIVKELQRQGIHAILTEPHELTINTLNKYLELKARGLI